MDLDLLKFFIWETRDSNKSYFLWDFFWFDWDLSFLSVFSEDELVSSYEDILDLVNTDLVPVQVSKELTNRIIVYSKLLIASEYFNSIHHYKNEHWFIGELANPYYNPSNINKYNGFTLVKHQKATYAGIIYFNCLTDLEKTIDMLGNDLKYLLWFQKEYS